MKVQEGFPNLLKLSDTALAVRFAEALDDVQRLADYCVRKQIARTDAALSARLEFFGVHPKTEHLAAACAELDWSKKQVIALLLKQEQK